jgi:iron complex transport system permease protein
MFEEIAKGAERDQVTKKITLFVLIVAILLELFLRIDSSNMMLVITELRLPRLVLAFAVGSALALSGLVMQTVLNNPLAEPYTLGVASGAALGAAIFKTLGISMGFFGLNVGAVFGAMLVLFVLFKIVFKTQLRFDSVVLLGVMLSFNCASMLSIWMALADPVGVQSVTFWLLGDLSRVGLKTSISLLFLSLIFFTYFFRFSKKLDAFLFGESMVEGFGVSLKDTQKVAVILVSILVGFCVSAAGMIGFVGLMVPHFVRKKMGSSLHQKVLPFVFVWGGICLILSDAIAHAIAFPLELPVGAVTSLLGAPVFIYLYVFQKSKGENVA